MEVTTSFFSHHHHTPHHTPHTTHTTHHNTQHTTQPTTHNNNTQHTTSKTPLEGVLATAGRPQPRRAWKTNYEPSACVCILRLFFHFREKGMRESLDKLTARFCFLYETLLAAFVI